MKVKVLLGTATIALVGFVGAVYAAVGQDMPDVPQASVVPVVEAEIESDTVDASPLVEQAPVAITAPEKVEDPVDTRPEWRKFLDDKLANDPDATYIVKCMLNTERTGITVSIMAPSVWRNSDDALRDSTVESFYNRFSAWIFRNAEPGRGDVLDRLC